MGGQSGLFLGKVNQPCFSMTGSKKEQNGADTAIYIYPNDSIQCNFLDNY